MSQPTPEQFLSAIESDSNLLAAAARKGLDADVPSCPGWTMRKLVVHTGNVQRGKEVVVRERLDTDDVKIERPRGDVIEWFLEGASKLLETLRAADPSEHCWSWHKPDQTVGFWYRRMAQEALIHRVDAELAFGQVSPLDPVIAEDGVDEALEAFIAGAPAWATSNTEETFVKLSTPGRSWMLQEGSWSGTTRSGRVFTDVPTVLIAESDAEPVCEISGDPAALDLWLWGRAPMSDLTVTGDVAHAERLRAVAADST